MKKLLLTALCLLGLFSLNAQEPETVTVGSGSVITEFAPTNVGNSNNITQQIFVAEDMQNKSGKVTGLAFKCTNRSATRNLKVYMKNVNKTSFASDSDWESLTSDNLVFEGFVTFTSGEWATITLSNSFTYKKGQNLLLCVNDVTGNWQQLIVKCASDEKSEDRLLYTGGSGGAYDATDMTSTIGSRKNILNHVQFTIVDDGSGEDLDEAPDAPTDLTAKPLSDTEIELSWTASENATGYKVYQKGNETAIATVSTTTYVVKDLTPGTEYCFTVTAVADQESEHSNEACTETLSKLTTFAFNFEEGSFYNNTLEGLRVYQGDGANPKQDRLNWGTVEDRIATGNPQTQKYFAGKDGSRAVYSMSIDPNDDPSFLDNYYTPDNYIVTTKSYLITETSAIEWDIRQAVDGKEDNYSIVVSEDGVNFREVWYERYSNGSGATKAISLAKEAGKELYIGFRHYEITYGGALILDNVKLVTESTLTPEDEYDPDAPRIPTKVEAVGWSATTLKVRWNASQNAESYNIYSADTLVVKGVTATEYTVENLKPETNYCFKVSAVKGDKESAKSSEACDFTLEEEVTYLDAPTNLKATYASEYDIRLTWDKVEKADVYNVYQDGVYLLSVGKDEPTHLATNLDKNTTYCFEVTAVSGNDDNKVESDKSNKICTSIAELENSTDDEPEDPEDPTDTIAPTPTAPVAPVVTAEATSDTTIVLTWNAVEGAESYNVYQGTDTVAVATAVKDTTYTVKGLKAETEYAFTVTAVNAAGESAKSAEVKAKTLKAEGLEELSAAINIYPNPVGNELRIATEMNVKEIAIYDIYGRQQAISYQLSAVSSVNVAELNSGIYFVKIVTNEGEIVKRFVKK